jgi:hypothetical protein
MEWVASDANMESYDYVDLDTAMRVSAPVRPSGHAHAEIWPAAEWGNFKRPIRDLPGVVIPVSG